MTFIIENEETTVLPSTQEHDRQAAAEHIRSEDECMSVSLKSIKE